MVKPISESQALNCNNLYLLWITVEQCRGTSQAVSLLKEPRTRQPGCPQTASEGLCWTISQHGSAGTGTKKAPHRPAQGSMRRLMSLRGISSGSRPPFPPCYVRQERGRYCSATVVVSAVPARAAPACVPARLSGVMPSEPVGTLANPQRQMIAPPTDS